jgi:hypothetical protein
MATSAEIRMLRTLDPGVVIPGIDTPTGNPLPTSQLQSCTTLTTNQNAPVYYNGQPTNWICTPATSRSRAAPGPSR